MDANEIVSTLEVLEEFDEIISSLEDSEVEELDLDLGDDGNA